jgi:hypothetical protein
MILAGRFSMVCRDANTHRARDVHPLIISTPQEQALYAMGEGLSTSFSNALCSTNISAQT